MVNMLELEVGGSSLVSVVVLFPNIQETLFHIVLITQGPVVQKLVNANPELKVNQGFSFSC